MLDENKHFTGIGMADYFGGKFVGTDILMGES